jgi:hypothetical protein
VPILRKIQNSEKSFLFKFENLPESFLFQLIDDFHEIATADFGPT